MKNWDVFVVKKLIKLDQQEVKNCRCIKRGIPRLWVDCGLELIQGLQNKVNSLSDAREFDDPESGSSSGATHVPDRTSTIPIQVPEPSRAAILDCRVTHWMVRVLQETFVNAHLLGKDYPLQSSTIQRIWHLHLRIWDLIFQRQQGERNEKRIVERVDWITSVLK